LGFSRGIIAGAIISGAYFGDKISPLSDTTNLAAGMAGTSIFTHIRYMLYTTIPSFILTLVIFLILGISEKSQVDYTKINRVLETIETHFNLSPFLVLVPLLVILMVIKQIPPFPALLTGALAGGLAAAVFQPELLKSVAETEDFTKAVYVGLFKALTTTIQIPTENKMANELLVTRGMEGMLNTIWLIISAMVFGGVMEYCGLLVRITESLVKFSRNTASLIATTTGACIFFNLTASDQYLSIVVPGRMFGKLYEENGLKPENLSRTLEDSGTVTSVLVPWNTCGATQTAVLGVATTVYLPFCFFNLISPLMTIIFAVFKIKIARTSNQTPDSKHID
jgi:NhaC family Na+:H+ antiporter